jgi:hypothetical protein
MRYLLFLLFPLLLNAQIVSVGLDISNAIQGSDVNTPALNIQAKIGSITKNREIGFQAEMFNEIKYWSYGMYFNHVIRLNKFEIAIGGEGNMIIRKEIGVLSYGFNGEFRYFFSNKLGISYNYNIRRRTDLQLLYEDGRFVNSGFINLIYKWK